jgi:hypothetical protein
MGELDHRACTPLDGPDVAVEVGGDVPRHHTVDAKVPVRGARASAFALCWVIISTMVLDEA